MYGGVDDVENYETTNEAVVKGDTITTCNPGWSPIRHDRPCNSTKYREFHRVNAYVKVVIGEGNARVGGWMSCEV